MIKAAIHPGKILLDEFIEPLELSVRAFAAKSGISHMTLGRFIRGETDVTVKLAIMLAAALNTTPQFWLNMQISYIHAHPDFYPYIGE